MERAKPDLKAEAQRTVWTRTNSSTSGEMLKLHSWYDGVVWILLQWQFNRCINIDSIWFYPRHSFLSPSFVPSSAFASPERVNNHLHVAKKCLQKWNFLHVLHKKRTDINKSTNSKKGVPKTSIVEWIQLWVPKAFGFAALLTFLAFTFAGFIILPMGQSHKATWLKLIEKFKQLYV